MDTAPPLSMQFVTLLTDFTKENGGTALRPHSHHVPKYPEDEQEFHANMVQVEGKAGDVVRIDSSFVILFSACNAGPPQLITHSCIVAKLFSFPGKVLFLKADKI